MTDPNPTPTAFGFTVKQKPIHRSPAGPDQGHPGWVVYLPHQCDSWCIAAGFSELEGVPHAEAVAELERFIAEACAARDALVRKESMGL